MPAVMQDIKKAPERSFNVAAFVDVSKTTLQEKPVAEALLKSSPNGDKSAETKPEPKPEDKPKEEAKTEDYEKRYKDSQKHIEKVSVENKQLKASVAALEVEKQAQADQLKRIEAKLDGTYDPAQDGKNAPSPEQLTKHAETMGRLKASFAAAADKFGKESVVSRVFADGAPYQELEKERPWVSARVMGADSPVLEALQVLDEEEFFKTYGRDPKQIREKLEAELLPKVRKELLAELKSKPGQPVQGLGDVRTGSEGKAVEKPVEVDFTKLFPNLTRQL